MSEWKYCADPTCYHHFRAHRGGKDIPFKGGEVGACTVPGCKCEQMEWDLSDL